MRQKENRWMHFEGVCLLAAAVSLAAGGADGLAQDFTIDFEGYADTAALQGDFVQSAVGGGHWIQPEDYIIHLDSEVPGAIGNTVRLSVTPTEGGPGTPEWTGVWLYRGGASPFPSGVFQNGTDFSVWYDVRIDINALDSWKTRVCSPAFCVPENYDVNFNQNHCFTFTQATTTNSWSLEFACYEGEDIFNGDSGDDVTANGAPFSPILNEDTWYRCGVLVDWVQDGNDQGTQVNVTFKVWPRETGSYATATTYTFPLADISRLPLGSRTGDIWGIGAYIYDNTILPFNVWYDNIQFVEGLEPDLATPTPTSPPTATPTPFDDEDGDGVPDSVEARVPQAGQTNMYLPDSDGDGFSDGMEDANRNGSRDPSETDTRDRDSDADGYEDGIELLLVGSDPLNPGSPSASYVDSDGDALPDSLDPNSLLVDTDEDRFLDGYEAVALGAPAVTDPAQIPSLGDVIPNSVWDNADSQMILNFFARTEVLPEFDPTRSDVNRDAFIDNGDAQVVLIYFARMLPELPFVQP